MASWHTKVPRLLAGVDLTKLPLSPLEGFVLSRIDGSQSVAILADLTNLDPEVIGKIVDRLIQVGAVEWARESVSLPRFTGRPATRTPAKPFSPPPELRAPVKRFEVPRPRASVPPDVDAAQHMYRSRESAEERIDPSRRSAPNAPPRASHTGTLHPAGEIEEIEDLGTADTLPPPPPVPLPHEEATDATASSEAAPSSEEDALDELIVEDDAPPEPPPVDAAVSKAESEPLDLDPERRKRIDDLYVALELLDHYQMLGVARETGKDEVRAAYFQLSKVFHPDTMFRKRLGPYKAKMEAIFHRLTEAYDVLGKKRAREEYDRYLALQDRTRAAEEVLEIPPAPEAAAPETVPEVEAKAPEPVEDKPAPETKPARASSEAARARARELMAKKLRNAARASQSLRGRTPGNTPEPAPEPPTDRKEVLRSLASSLRDSSQRTGSFDKAQRHVLNARRAEAQGDLAEASRELRIAVELAPDREEIRGEHARVSSLLSAALASTYEEQARYEQRHRKWGAAALSWARVFEGRPDDARAARLAADALVEAKGDLHRASELAQRAAELAPNDVENLHVLGKVYIAAGLHLNARRVLRQAATLDPSNELVETLLRGLER